MNVTVFDVALFYIIGTLLFPAIFGVVCLLETWRKKQKRNSECRMSHVDLPCSWSVVVKQRDSEARR